MTHQDATDQRHPRQQSAGLRGPMGSGRVPGPRQEYVDAFDDQNFGRVSEPRPAAGTGPQRVVRDPRPAGHQYANAGSARAGGGASTGQHPVVAGSAGSAAGPDADEPAAQPRGRSRGGKRRAPKKSRRERREAGERGGWGRTLTGVASAAVVTVLAVVVAVQIALPDEDAESQAELNELAGLDGADGPDGAGGRGPDAGEGGDGTGTDLGREEPPPAEPTYQELLDTPFEMAPDLAGSGELVPVGGSDPAPDPDATTVVRYRVDVEEGLGVDPEFFAEAVQRTLNDDRSWGSDGERSFARVSTGDYDFVVTLASPGTTAEWCDMSGLDVREDNVSCNSSFTERVMINAWRWAQGSETYGDDIAGYRQMLVNHEVGHRLGYGHALCPANGALAPVMMQQTKFLATEGHTCEPNPWPHPEN
ncbi:DUF3152 domain-containing protein [Streptomyces sp. B6B3]|uniref:DUF3152 domain-containing protein n=1 Tax=Streptomyces sp. B6B3 TaxID=3153570 RepID=UPI00325E33AA